jgi:hypothetical protein
MSIKIIADGFDRSNPISQYLEPKTKDKYYYDQRFEKKVFRYIILSTRRLPSEKVCQKFAYI